MFHRNESLLRDGTGLAVAGATLTVYVHGTDANGDYTNATKATLYSADNPIPGNVIANPITTDVNGDYDYYVADGSYDEVAKYGSITEVRSDIQMADLFGAAVAAAAAAAAVVVGGFLTRAALAAAPFAVITAAYLQEPGREGEFVWSAANLQTLVTADTQQGIYVPPTGGNGSTGAWVRTLSGPTVASWWGFYDVTTGVTAAQNLVAINSALNTLNALALTGYGYNKGSIPLYIPGGKRYQLSGKVVVPHAVKIFGDCTGQAGSGSVLQWTSDDHGFESLGWDGASVHANGAVISGFHMIGTNAGANCHAINQTGNLRVEHCYFQNWSGDGIHADSTAGGLSGSMWVNCSGDNIGSTLWIKGSNSAGCMSIGISAAEVRFHGIRDSSGIGCTHFPGVINGVGNVAGYVTRCHVGGHIYMVASGQQAGASANAPTGAATSNTWWLYLAEGLATAQQPTWSAAQTWYHAAPIWVDPNDASVQSTVTGGYIEVGLSAVIVNDSTTLVRGQWLSPILRNDGSKASYMRGSGAWTEFGNAIRTAGPFGNDFKQDAHTFGGGQATDTTITFKHGNVFTALQFFSAQGATYAGRFCSVGVNMLYDYDLHEFRSKSGGVVYADLDANFNLYAGAYKINSVTVINSSGILQAVAFPALTGDVTNVAGALAATVVAAATGTGSFLTSGGKVGYRAGAGGTQTQGTSRTTGVTLNKATGKLALFSTTTTAGQTTTFVFTNSQLGANDTIEFTQRTGAGVYFVSTKNNGDGTASVSVYTPAAVAVAEAPEFLFTIAAGAIS